MGSLETAKGLEIPKAYSTAKTGLRQLKKKKKNTKKHKKQKVDTFFSGIRDPARKMRKPKVTSHSAKERYLGEPEQGAIKKEVAAKIFEPVELDFAYSGKMTKRKDSQKLNH